MIRFEIDDLSMMGQNVKIFTRYLEEGGADADTVFDSKLVISELVTNVLRHCGCAARFTGEFVGGIVTITVNSAQPTGKIAIPTLPDVLSEGGRGLYIINAVSDGNVEIDGGSVTVRLKSKQ